MRHSFVREMFIPTILDNPGNPLFWLVIIFIVLIAVACLIPRYRNLSLRIIGGTIFGCYRAYVVNSVGQEDLLRAIKGLIIFGLPGLYFAVFGNYPD